VVPDAARAAARAFAVKLGASRLVALHPGVSDFGSIKRWDPARYAAVARHLRDDHGARCVVTWGPDDRALAEEVVAASRDASVLAPATPSLLDLAALYECCDVVVGGDTGPIHLAAALGVPVIGLYGPKDPAVYAPWDARTGAPSAAIWKQVACSPCTLRRCDDVVCMPAIQIGDVTGAVRRAFESGEPPRSRAQSR
jgi:heptosyltransferase-1